MSIYLDANATMPIRPEVIETMSSIMAETGNASSIHGLGRKARAHVEKARDTLASVLNTKSTQIVFNAGATESLNTVLKHFNAGKILVSATEHPAGFEPLKEPHTIPVHANGVIDLDALEEQIKTVQPELISVMLVNNETGVIQPIKEMVSLAHANGVLVHSDASQALGRIVIDVEDLGVDYMSFSAHKCGGPQGVGALYFKPTLNVPKMIYGGGQEKSYRAGTENVAGIAGFGIAAELALTHMDAFQDLGKFRDKIEEYLHKNNPGVKIWGNDTLRVSNTSCFTLAGVPASTLLMNFDMAGICVSSGSACSSGKVKGSKVLHAMGAKQAEIESAIRISLSWQTTAKDIDLFLEEWEKIYARVKHKVS